MILSTFCFEHVCLYQMEEEKQQSAMAGENETDCKDAVEVCHSVLKACYVNPTDMIQNDYDCTENID